jgi:plastocyanin domain-containing protein
MAKEREKEITSSVKGGSQRTTTQAQQSTQVRQSGTRTDQSPVHQGIQVNFRLAIYQPRLGTGGGTLECP